MEWMIKSFLVATKFCKIVGKLDCSLRILYEEIQVPSIPEVYACDLVKEE